MSLDSEFADFGGTNAVTFEKNDAREREYVDKRSFLKTNIPTLLIPSKEPCHVRLIPWPGFNYFAKKCSVHFQIGPEKNSYPCLKMLGDEHVCPICKASRIAYSAGNKELGGALKATQRHLLIVIDRKNPEKGPMILQWSDTAVDDLRNRINDPITKAPRPIDHILHGFDIMFTKRQKEKNSKFETIEDMFVANQSTPLGDSEQQIRTWLEYTRATFGVEFLSLFDFKTADELEAVLNGSSDIPGLKQAVGDSDPFANAFGQQSNPAPAPVQVSVSSLFPQAAQVPAAPVTEVPVAPVQTVPPPAPKEVPVAPVQTVPEQTVQTVPPVQPVIPAVVEQVGNASSDDIRAKIKAQLEAAKQQG